MDCITSEPRTELLRDSRPRRERTVTAHTSAGASRNESGTAEVIYAFVS